VVTVGRSAVIPIDFPTTRVDGGDGFDILYFHAVNLRGVPLYLDQPGAIGHHADNFEQISIIGGRGQTVRGGDRAHRILADGEMTLYGSGGDDVLEAGGGSVLWGEAGNDRLIVTQGGSSSLYGGDGDDILSSGSGNDYLEGGSGNDVIDGGSGRDVAFFSGNYQDYRIMDVGGQLLVWGAQGKTYLRNVETLKFSNGNYDPSIIVCRPELNGDGAGAAGKLDTPLVLPGTFADVAEVDPPVRPGLAEANEQGPLVLPGVRADGPTHFDQLVVCRPGDQPVTDGTPGTTDPELSDLALVPEGRDPFGRSTASSDCDWII